MAYTDGYIWADFHPILGRNTLNDLYINSPSLCIKIQEQNIL